MIILQEIIDELIKKFDWDKVHDYMVQTNWVWGMIDNDELVERIPTIDELKNNARDMLANDFDCSTGGFHVIRTDGSAELIFGISSKLAFKYNEDIVSL